MPTSLVIDRDTLTIDEVAAKLGIDRGTAYRLAKRDALPVPVIRLGKRVVIGRVALDRVLAGETVTPPRQMNGGGDNAAA